MTKTSAKRFLRFSLASLLSSALDLGLFALIAAAFSSLSGSVFIATAIARISSGAFNFLINKFLVFKERRQSALQGKKYFALFLAQMAVSSFLVWLLSFLPVPLVLIKIAVDGSLFLLSYQIQRRFIFSNNEKKGEISGE